MQHISSNNLIVLSSKHFHLWQWSFYIVLFSENNVCTWPLKIKFSIVALYLWVLESCPNELYKDCHRQTPKLVIWTHSLVITPQPKGAFFSHRKRWVVTTGLKYHKIMQKQIFQHLILALFIHFMKFLKVKFWNDTEYMLVTFSLIFILLFHLAIERQRCPGKDDWNI